jgi:hypothetical protein
MLSEGEFLGILSQDDVKILNPSGRARQGDKTRSKGQRGEAPKSISFTGRNWCWACWIDRALTRTAPMVLLGQLRASLGDGTRKSILSSTCILWTVYTVVPSRLCLLLCSHQKSFLCHNSLLYRFGAPAEWVASCFISTQPHP